MRGHVREARGHHHHAPAARPRHHDALGVRAEARHYAFAAGATIATVLTVAAAATTAAIAAYSAYNQNQNEQDLLKYNQKVATANARAADDAAAANAEVQRERAAKFLSTQRAAVGATGATLDSGSALSLMADSAYNAEMDAQRLLYEGHYKAWQYDTQAAGFRWQRLQLADNQWTNTLLAGVGAGVKSYASSGYPGLSSEPTAKVGGYGAGETLLTGSIPRYNGRAGYMP